jgi:anaerobic magnesium-protoporphyrin IX monomethyl ester cyclase
MFRRVLLIAPPSSTFLGAVRPPSGLGYLAQALLENDIEYSIWDIRDHLRWDDLSAGITHFRPDLIGVSLVSFEYKYSYNLIERIKAFRPQTPIVVGGPHVFVLRESVLRDCPAIDYAVVGDGEQALVRLCQGEMPLEEMRGLVYRRDGEILSGPSTSFIENLDSVSFPRFVGFEMNRYAREMPLITSRGCPHRCIFCPNSRLAQGFRARSASHVVDEIQYWYERGIRKFNIDDDNFTLIKDRVYEICDEIERRGLKDLFIRCANGLRADRVDRPLLARMKEVGVREVGIGADGGNDRVLQEVVHKGETMQDIENAIQAALDVGLQVKLFATLGNPGETLADIQDTFALAERYPFLRVQLYNPIPYPGTELYEIVSQRGLFVIPPEEYLNSVQDDEGITPVFETPELPADVRRQILKRARKLQRAVTRRATERLFQGTPIVSKAAGYFFSSQIGQWFFFKNMFTRSLINRVWYKKMVSD